MKNIARPAALLAALLCATALLAYEAGDPAYTKRVETKLLAEPKPLAATTGKLTYGRKVKIEEVRGAWLRVSDGPAAGWVFAGNLSAIKLDQVKGLDGLGLSASNTTATAAARPLDQAAADYASGNNLASAQDDLEWMITACAAITDEDVEAYLQENKKGEYQ